jgi:hypothetical protein
MFQFNLTLVPSNSVETGFNGLRREVSRKGGLLRLRWAKKWVARVEEGAVVDRNRV